MLLHPLTLLLQRPLRRVKTSQKQKGPYLYLMDAQRCEVGKKASSIGTADTFRYYAHKFPKLRLTECTVRRLKDEYNDFVKDLPQEKEKNLKNCLAKRSRADHFCWAMSWTCRCESTSSTFVNEGLPLILQW